MRVLVTGGAGYIGSHTVVQLAAAGHEAVIVDDFRNACSMVMERVTRLSGRLPVLERLEAANPTGLDDVLRRHPVDAIIHFAGLKAAAESVTDPLLYYRANLGGIFGVLEAARRHRVDILLFSSSAAVYGAETPPPFREDSPTAPANPYGRTKLMIEQVLRDVSTQQCPRRVGILRYFNAVGAHPSGQIGEDPRGVPNNLVPYIAQVAAGIRRELRIFGADYPTTDGTCLRDYIHVEDLAAGHLAALDALRTGPAGARTWNLGTGEPTSVLQMHAAFERAVGAPIPYRIVERRPGDPPASYADVTKASVELGWVARRTVDQMCTDTWRWQSANPNGYAA